MAEDLEPALPAGERAVLDPFGLELLLDPPDATFAGSDWIDLPSISSETGTLLTAPPLWFTRPAVTTMRSWFSKRDRCRDTGVTARFDDSADATFTGEYYTKRGPAGGIDFRVVPDANSRLLVESLFAKDRRGQGGQSARILGYGNLGLLRPKN